MKTIEINDMEIISGGLNCFTFGMLFPFIVGGGPASYGYTVIKLAECWNN